MGPSIRSGVVDDIEEFVAGNDEDTAFWYSLRKTNWSRRPPARMVVGLTTVAQLYGNKVNPFSHWFADMGIQRP